jgi:hypothetical protein
VLSIPQNHYGLEYITLSWIFLTFALPSEKPARSDVARRRANYLAEQKEIEIDPFLWSHESMHLMSVMYLDICSGTA